MQPVEKFSPKQLSEYALKTRLSRFKIHLYMKRPPNRTYYGTESCTLQKVVGRQLTQIDFDGQRGLDNCRQIALRNRGHYTEAVIYQRYHNEEWVEVQRFIDGQAPVVQLPAQPRVVKMQVVHNAYDGSVIFKQAA